MRTYNNSKRKYTYIFAEGATHAPITSLKQLHSMRWLASLGLFCNGVPVGTARLEVLSMRAKTVHTDSVYLDKKHRRKGHGIMLYKALITAARKLDATRIYSSTNLNKFSGRMWGEKLGRAGFNVVHRSICKHPCRHCKKKARHYIEL